MVLEWLQDVALRSGSRGYLSLYDTVSSQKLPSYNTFISFLALSHVNPKIAHSSFAIGRRDYSSSPSNTFISTKGKLRVSNRFENVKCLDDAVSVFRQMVREQPLPSPVSFSKLLKIMVNMKHYSDVVSLFGEMQKLGISTNEFILSIVINSYCLMHRADLGFSVLAIFFKTGIPYNVVTFNTLIGGLFAENKVKDAVHLFKKLTRENICEPNEVMYATVMNGLSKRGHTGKFFSLLRLMEQGSTKPDTCIYSIVIDALCKDRMLDDAINLLNEMKQKGVPPDIITYSSLIDGLCKFGRWENVRTMFDEMVNLNIYPTVYTFSIVINGLCKEGKAEDRRGNNETHDQKRCGAYCGHLQCNSRWILFAWSNG
uniref:Pentatricopeptide repeat-containing protein At1g62670, mitochondrial-like n=1 Tax=Nicotiana tabacum TaxID=4097 RepID=A0A1S4ABM5_TOBAC|nr:PREDICTED: pentatricopeptide repeat-containing protein At1g62670, mitochondrial-like [Nicotiana tabacum]